MRLTRGGSPVAGFAALALALAAYGCGAAPGPGHTSVRLVDLFKPDMVQGAGAAQRTLPRTEWRFDDASASAAKEFAATRGWEAGAGISGLAIRDGRLVGRSTNDFPMLRVARTRDLENADQLHAVEIRLRVSAGANLSLTTRAAGPVDLPRVEQAARGNPWTAATPLLPGDEFQTYTVTSLTPINMQRAQQMILRPTDAKNATFEIESVRMISRREHLAGITSGVGWQGLSDVFRESLISRSPETIRFSVDVPPDGWLDLAVGTMEDHPPTFRVAVTAEPGAERVLLEQTVTTANRWEPHAIDLAEFAGRTVSLALSLSAGDPGTLGFWGTAAVRASGAAAESRPRGVILIQADTLRADHLGVYGHSRDTAPFLTQLAAEGALFRHAFAQAGWTKVSTSSFMTSLYPTTHGVRTQSDRLPAAATTTAEIYRAAGYATVAYSSVAFTGMATNLHQGFEELHERSSVAEDGQYRSKTAREFVDRASGWIARHRDVPFFMYLHAFDPHSPFEPRRPHDAKYADLTRREHHLAQLATVRKVIADGFLAGQGMATREEMVKAGIDPAEYIAHEKDWYDGSITGLDAELARLFERLRQLGLDREVAVAFLADHGEEFHEHGRMWHGQSVYGEMMHVPLVVRWPAGLPAGRVVEEPVHLIDVMPTLLDLSGLEQPDGLQGQSLLPLLREPANGDGSTAAWKRRPIVMEKQPLGQPEHPSATEAYAIIDGNWKLIHNVVRPPERPEYELFAFPADRLDSKNVAAENPDVVQRLAKALGGWRQMATAARLKPDAETTKSLSAGELQRLRSLGYVRD